MTYHALPSWKRPAFWLAVALCGNLLLSGLLLAVTLSAPVRPSAPPAGNHISAPAAVPSAPSGPRQRPHPALVYWSVRPGDTLWGIARSRYGDGRCWVAVWRANPQIAVPGLIYPRQVLALPYHCPKVSLTERNITMSEDSSAFYGLPGEERAALMEAACQRYGVSDFYDLDPDQRHAVYREATSAA